jgi:aspartyl-tRNA(Asn)/glutamyl-tRNA(Gln) amidotransferase subunit A
MTMPRSDGYEADGLCALGISELAELIARRDVSPTEACRASITRYRETEPELNSFISLDEDRVAADAAVLETEVLRGHLRGPLHGVPIAVKDNIAVRGERTTAGSTVLHAGTSGHDATVVARLRDAGALIFGKTNLPEFAYGPVDSYHYGPTRNPWDPSRYAGGSSMGSAAAVASGVVPGALGTDTTGSIRNPATWCGVVGRKPAYGLVPLRGVVPLATTFDHVGPIARSAEDCATILGVIAGSDDLDPTTAQCPPVDLEHLDRPVAGLRLGLVRQLWDSLDVAIAAPLVEARAELTHLGAEFVDVDIPMWDDVVDASHVLVDAEAAFEYRSILEASESRLLPQVSARLRAGTALSAPDYVQALRTVAQFRHQYLRALRDVHLLAMPGHHRTAPRIDSGGRRLEPSSTLRFVIPMNAIGTPALTVPVGFVDGLPISLQLTGNRGSDGLLLSVGHAYQRATNWHQARSPRFTSTTTRGI